MIERKENEHTGLERLPSQPPSYPVPGEPEADDFLLAFELLNAMGKLPNKTLAALASQAYDFLEHRPPDPVSLYRELLLPGVRAINALFTLSAYLEYVGSTDGALASDISTTIVTVITDGEGVDEEDFPALEELVEFVSNAGWLLLKALDLARKLAEDCGGITELAWAETCNLAKLLRTKFGDMGKADTSTPEEYLLIIFLAASLRLDDTVTKAIHVRIANKSAAKALNQRYMELTGDQYYPEKTARDYLDNSLDYIMRSPLLDGRPLKHAKRVLKTLESLIQKFQAQAIKEIEQSRHLEELGNPFSLDTEIEGEDGEVSTLSDMIAAPPDLEEALPQLLEIWENLDPEDARLLTERFKDGRSFSEIASERGWNYGRAQKRIERLLKEVLEKMSD
jgi:hypothetical protein